MKTFRNKIATGLAAITLGAGSLIGCGELFYTHPVDKFIMDNVIPSGLLPQSIKDKQTKEQGSWAGTPVVSKDIDSNDGTIIFIIDAYKGDTSSWTCTDPYVGDIKNYRKETYLPDPKGRPNIGIVKYIPKKDMYCELEVENGKKVLYDENRVERKKPEWMSDEEFADLYCK